jgi:hypothetical protein
MYKYPGERTPEGGGSRSTGRGDQRVDRQKRRSEVRKQSVQSGGCTVIRILTGDTRGHGDPLDSIRYA